MTALWRKIKEVDVNTFDNYLCIQLVLPDNPWKAVVTPIELQNSCTAGLVWELAVSSEQKYYLRRINCN